MTTLTQIHFFPEIFTKRSVRRGRAAGGEAGRTELSAPSPVMSNRLDRRLRFVRLDCRMKCFWAWLATWVGVRVVT